MVISYGINKRPLGVADIQTHDVIQLDPETTSNPMFGRCFAIVSDVKGWGVQCYVPALGEDGKPGGDAFYRAAWGTFVLIGRAEWHLPE